MRLLAFLALLLAPIAAEAAIPVVAAGNPVTGGTNSAIVTGGTAVVLVTGPINGCQIVNPLNAAAQKIATAENAYVDPVGTPGATDGAANGTTVLLAPGQPWNCPFALPAGAVVKANAASSSHAFTVIVW